MDSDFATNISFDTNLNVKHSKVIPTSIEKKVKKRKLEKESLVEKDESYSPQKVKKRKRDKEKTLVKKDEFHSSQKKAHRPIISSVFNKNPEIPSLNVTKQEAVSEPLFSAKTFGDMLMIHPHLISCLENVMKLEKLTTVQEKTIPVLLRGQDALVKSCTGSGKTLAYAIPIVQKLQSITPKIKRSDGVFALIVVPTRELALQCYESFSILTKAFTWVVPGYLVGGENKRAEKARLRKGINILICTPGRILDHLEHTACLSLDKISWLVIDEADRLLEQGFQASVVKIITSIKNERQTVLLSATLTKAIEALANISLTNPVHIDVASEIGEEFKLFTLPKSLKQFIVIVPSKLRLITLSAYIVEQCLTTGFKGLIFMTTMDSVDFHHALFSGVLVPLIANTEHKCKFFKLHGNMKQEERTEVFTSFRAAKKGILLCTDVAARGIDIPKVDWVVQYSAPASLEMYVHRVGRTARIGKEGSSLLFLLPSESKFTDLLHEQKIQFQEKEIATVLKSLMLVGEDLKSTKKFTAELCATVLQTKYEDEVYSEKELHDSAKSAFSSYVKAYATYSVKSIFPFHELHLGHVAKSFCIREAPSRKGFSSKMKYAPKYNRKINHKGVQYKKSKTVSEYDSGLSQLKGRQVSKAKRRKR